MADQEDTRMENRITHLEHGFNRLSGEIGDISGKVNAVSGEVKRLDIKLDKVISVVEANKPISYTSMLATAIGTATLVSMIAASIFFLIDARVGSATIKTNAFVDNMTSDGRLYVAMDRLSSRLDRVESAIKWTPSIMSFVDEKKR